MEWTVVEDITHNSKNVPETDIQGRRKKVNQLQLDNILNLQSLYEQ